MKRNLDQVVSTFIRKHGLAGKKLVVAVSGGPDSVCLLHLLSGLRDKLDVSFHVAHLDHQLRGMESQADAEYVALLAKEMGLPFTIGQADVRAYQRRRKLSLEEAAREVRYHFLAEVAEGLDTAYVVTGHTADDQLETILLHIVRGSGTRGLVGLKPLTPWTMGKWHITIVRPLLGISRQETQAYCRDHGLNPRTDATNLSLSPLRNKVRLQLLPLLKNYNPAVGDGLLRTSTIAADETDYLDEQVGWLYESIVKKQGNAVELKRDGLITLHKALQRHLLRACVKEVLGHLKDIENRHIEEMLSLLDKPAGRQVDLPYGLLFLADYKYYWLGRQEDVPCPYPLLEEEYALTVPGISELPGWEVRASIDQTCAIENAGELKACFDIDRVGQRLSVRAWRRGDRFMPLGMDAEKKIGQFMLDAKIPRHWRNRVPMVVADRQVIWLVNYRIDERVKVTDSTRRVLKLEFKPL
jgi:tRNA(Ile)-lysidine synthase